MDRTENNNHLHPLLEPLEDRVLFSTFYLAPGGDDANSGLSPSQAWRSLARAGQAAFSAGDRLLLQGGATFRGQLYFGPDDHGTSDNPITVSSFGQGRATINAGGGTGIFVYNTAGLTLQNLRILGSGAKSNHGDGIHFYNNLSHDTLLSHAYVNNVESSGFGGCGVSVGGWNGFSGFNDVRITNAKLHDNARAGLMTYAPRVSVHQNVYVAQVIAYNNTGIARSTVNTGSGIVLGSVNNATIEWSVAHDNSRLGHGAVGIWAYDSNNVTIQHNESYRNRTTAGDDGDGFDLDRNVTNSTLQYNYSHDNDGSGFGLYQNGLAGHYFNNAVRYNISQNDGQKNGYGGIDMWGPVQNSVIENNTVFVTPSAAHPAAMRIISDVSQLSGVEVRNNIFHTTGGAPSSTWPPRPALPSRTTITGPAAAPSKSTTQATPTSASAPGARRVPGTHRQHCHRLQPRPPPLQPRPRPNLRRRLQPLPTLRLPPLGIFSPGQRSDGRFRQSKRPGFLRDHPPGNSTHRRHRDRTSTPGKTRRPGGCLRCVH